MQSIRTTTETSIKAQGARISFSQYESKVAYNSPDGDTVNLSTGDSGEALRSAVLSYVDSSRWVSSDETKAAILAWLPLVIQRATDAIRKLQPEEETVTES